ncbi:MAG: Flp family type IVb pilin [Alphaproteobacteria bacterium]|nr:Flp family type IVb pilin [Alphaproteobacteria bacterium]
MSTISRLIRDEDGTTAVDYALIVALVFLAMVSGVTALGGSLQDLYNYAERELTAAIMGGIERGQGQ